MIYYGHVNVTLLVKFIRYRLGVLVRKHSEYDFLIVVESGVGQSILHFVLLDLSIELNFI